MTMNEMRTSPDIHGELGLMNAGERESFDIKVNRRFNPVTLRYKNITENAKLPQTKIEIF